MSQEKIFQIFLISLFSFGFCAGLIGIFQYPQNVTAFTSVFVISTGGIILMAPSQFTRFSLGLKGVEAELRDVKGTLTSQEEIIKTQQRTINDLVIYSVAEIIYRELLWRIGHNYNVTCDHTIDQHRWLTFLFDHGLLQARDTTRWLAFDQIPVGQNLSEIFAPTPAAEFLMQLRGPPT